jgi:hypothetical protein
MGAVTSLLITFSTLPSTKRGTAMSNEDPRPVFAGRDKASALLTLAVLFYVLAYLGLSFLVDFLHWPAERASGPFVSVIVLSVPVSGGCVLAVARLHQARNGWASSIAGIILGVGVLFALCVDNWKLFSPDPPPRELPARMVFSRASDPAPVKQSTVMERLAEDPLRSTCAAFIALWAVSSVLYLIGSLIAWMAKPPRIGHSP